MPAHRAFFVFTFLFCLVTAPAVAQTDLTYYLTAAAGRSPLVTDFTNQGEIAALEGQKLTAQLTRPRWFASADYLFAPYFADRGRFFAVTATPDPKAIGYDAGITNGGLISGQLNVEYQLLTGPRLTPLLQRQEILRRNAANQSALFLADQRRGVTNAYLQAYLLQSRLDFNDSLRLMLTEKRELVRKLADRAVMRVTDLELLNLEIGNIDYQRNELQLQLRGALLDLNNLAGITDTATVRLAEVLLPEAKSTSAAGSLFVEQYRLDSLAATNDQAVFEADYLPQLTAFANGGLNAVDLNNLYRKVGFSAGLRFTWLLEDGGRRDINRQQNELRRKTAAAYSRFTTDQLQNYRLANNQLLIRTETSIDLLTRQLSDYDRLLLSYRTEFAKGQLPVIDYLNVVRSYAELGQQLIEKKIDRQLLLNEANYRQQ